jgi:vacuolar-type H+-ATPase subunit I/STV1
MEGAEIGLVLAHAAELRLKISECIRRTGGERSAKSERYEEERDEEEEEEEEDEEKTEEKGDDEQAALLAICDALKSLEDQLSQLQVFLVYLFSCLSEFSDFGTSFDSDGEQLFSYISCSEACLMINLHLLWCQMVLAPHEFELNFYTVCA